MDEQKFKKLIEKINAMKKTGEIDLSLEEDLSIAVMNLVSLEEHFFFTAEKTGKEDYFDLLNETREIRKALLGRMVDRHEGETWCITKHLLAATMRLIEVGTKEFSKSNEKEASIYFKAAFDLYSLFFAINMRMIEVKNLEKISGNPEKDGLLSKFSLIIKRVVDCCKE